MPLPSLPRLADQLPRAALSGGRCRDPNILTAAGWSSSEGTRKPACDGK